jgi:hypothetical protein
MRTPSGVSGGGMGSRSSTSQPASRSVAPPSALLSALVTSSSESAQTLMIASMRSGPVAIRSAGATS